MIMMKQNRRLFLFFCFFSLPSLLLYRQRCKHKHKTICSNDVTVKKRAINSCRHRGKPSCARWEIRLHLQLLFGCNRCTNNTAGFWGIITEHTEDWKVSIFIFLHRAWIQKHLSCLWLTSVSSGSASRLCVLNFTDHRFSVKRDKTCNHLNNVIQATCRITIWHRDARQLRQLCQWWSP